jgi:hypothetical protein
MNKFAAHALMHSHPYLQTIAKTYAKTIVAKRHAYRFDCAKEKKELRNL